MGASGPSASSQTAGADPTRRYVRRHLRFGWWSVLVFLTLGTALEVMHGFKVDWYLNVANETRRLMWTLAHAHGVLLGLVHRGARRRVALRSRRAVRHGRREDLQGAAW